MSDTGGGMLDPIGWAHMVDATCRDHDAGYKVEGIGGSEPPAVLDLSVIDSVERVTDDESVEMTLRQWMKKGLLVGGSSSTALVAMLADSWDRYYAQSWVRSSPDAQASHPSESGRCSPLARASGYQVTRPSS